MYLDRACYYLPYSIFGAYEKFSFRIKIKFMATLPARSSWHFVFLSVYFILHTNAPRDSDDAVYGYAYAVHIVHDVLVYTSQ